MSTRHRARTRFVAMALAACACLAARADAPPACLPGELSADEMLNGAYVFPASPVVKVDDDWTGLAKEQLTKVPAPGVHPRILMSPEDLPDLRRRLKDTRTGQALYSTLQGHLDATLRNPKEWGSELYARLAEGDVDGAKAAIAAHKGFPRDIGHYKPWLYALVMEAFDALVTDDAARGKRVGVALAAYADIVRPGIERALAAPVGDDVWRAKTSGSVTGANDFDQGMRAGVGYHLLGYGYDFAHRFMDDAQRAKVRSLIATATAGRVWLGVRLPHHFRNWNWVAVGLSQPLLALAIEGEEGYDPRVYRMGVEVARDYLTYGISENGIATEAIGYIQFGFVWANPFIVAAARRGDNLLVHSHHRATVDWYLHGMEPAGDRWTSHGDGGDAPPAVWTLSMWRYFFPRDDKVSALWYAVQKASGGKMLGGDIHLIEPLLWAADTPAVADADRRRLGLPLTVLDEQRGSLLTRSGWDADATSFQFECRTDSIGADHTHADRGSFTLAALGRQWAKENFRSVETRHHSSVLIDGMGQGYWPGPSTWLGLQDAGGTLVASCDLKDNYGWWWPKQILTEDPRTFERFTYGRWESYGREAETFRKNYAGVPLERDTRPAVVAHWQGFEKTDPRMWDEDGWPARLPHNPVQRAFRTVAFTPGRRPFLLVVDDIQKDERERLYEWLMQTGPNTDVVSMSRNDIVLSDVTATRDADGLARPEKGERVLLVRVLDMNDPAGPHAFQSRPSFRLETFERRDTLVPDAGPLALSGSRTFGLDKRLVIASRSVAPDFKILVVPMRFGEAPPATTWADDRSALTVEIDGERTTLAFSRVPSGRTLVSRVTPAVR